MESTLSLTFDDLIGEVGLFLGYGRSSSAWTTTQTDAIRSCVRSGLRKFYFPEPVEGSQSSYEWSFLKPEASFTLTAGHQTVTLPDDFGGFEGQLTLGTANGQWCPIDLTGEGQVRQAYAQVQQQATGRPVLAAERPLKTENPRRGQRAELWVYPIADQDYTIDCVYKILPDAITADRPYPYGGMAHAETILESCLAVAEQRLDDAMTTHTLEFQKRLLASISQDRNRKPQLMGYNGDRSLYRRRDLRNRWWPSPVSVNGVVY